MELAGQRSAAAARLSDPLWFRVEDVLPATTEDTAMAMAAAKILPEQVQIVEAALANNNMTRADVTPQAFCVLLEQARRYALELIADAQDYAVCAGHSEMTKADFELASQMRPDHPISVTTQLPKLNLLAQQINRVPLPPIPTQCYSGILLPPKRHQLTARTFDVVSGAQVAKKMVQGKPLIATKKVPSMSTTTTTSATTSNNTAANNNTTTEKTSPKPSYGAARGRQIPIHLKDTANKEIPPSNPQPSDKSDVAAPTSNSTVASGGPTPMNISSPSVGPTTGGSHPPLVPSNTPGMPPASAPGSGM